MNRELKRRQREELRIVETVDPDRPTEEEKKAAHQRALEKAIGIE